MDQPSSEVDPVLGPYLVQVKQEPKEVEETQQLPEALSRSEPAVMGGTVEEGTPGSQPPTQKEVETSSEWPTPGDVSTLVFYWEPSSLVTTGTPQYCAEMPIHCV